MFRFFKPAAPIARLDDKRVRELFPVFRRQMLEATFIGYAVFYLVRNNLSPVAADIGSALAYSKSDIGDILAATYLRAGMNRRKLILLRNKRVYDGR